MSTLPDAIDAIDPGTRANAAEAIVFLRLLRPEGPWVLTAIEPNRKGIKTCTFASGQVDQLVAFHAKWNGKWNLYYDPNPLLRPVSKKSQKSDIKSCAVFHVDIDPRAGEDLKDERERIRVLVHGKPPLGIPAPSFIISSGGGYQLLWVLKEPIPINGSVEAAEEAERFNRQLANQYGGDNCFDLCHILRLPGTVNLPNEKKRKAGRVRTPAGLSGTPDPGLVYPVSMFKQAEALKAKRGASPAALGIEAHVTDLDDLDRWGVGDTIKKIINKGEDPKKPKRGDNSRSAWLYQVCCTLIRHDVPDSAIMDVIMNPRWKISDSVLELGAGAEGYARKQIESAHDDAESPSDLLAELNKKHAVLEQEGGKCRVLAWDKSELEHGREVLVLQSFADFRNRYLNRDVIYIKSDGKMGSMELGKWWLKESGRRQYTATRFDPSKDAEFDGYLNLWRGFAVEPVKGDWSLFRAHIKYLAGPDHEYVIKWMAWAFQNPDKPAEVAITFKGKRGTGKGFLGRTMVQAFGQHGLQIASSTHLTGNFNAHMRDLVVLFADEAFAVNDKKSEGILKAIVTEPGLLIEKKGVDAAPAPNRLHIIIASNNDWVIPAGADERRFAMFQVPDNKPSGGYFKALDAEIKNGGLAAMLHDLLAMDLGDWHPRQDVPNTDALHEQKRQGDSDALQWALGVLQARRIGAGRPNNKRAPARCYLSGHRPGSILEMMKLQSPGLRDLSDPKLTAILKEWGFTHWGVGGEVGWVAPSLIAMRKQWVANVRPETWDDDGEADWQDPAAEASFPDPEDYAQGGAGSGNWQVGQDERDLYETLQRKAD